MHHFYGEDLAYIHDVGFADFIAGSAPGILRLLKRQRITSGLVVDLGCGSGAWAETLLASGYQVLGVDASAAMIRLARRRATSGTFMKSTAQIVRLPRCAAVTAIGETLNYITGADPKTGLKSVFRRVFAALQPGGMFVFDLAEPALARDEDATRSFAEGADWAIVVAKKGDFSRHVLTRRIIAFRKVAKLFRRSEETHQLHLYDQAAVIALLQDAGFSARVVSRYGRQRLLNGRVGFVAVKPR